MLNLTKSLLGVLSPSLLLLAVYPAASCAQKRAGAGELDYGRRVQVTSSTLGSGWHEGVVGYMSRGGERAECPTIFIPVPGPRKTLKAIPLASITGLRVSNRVEGTPRSGSSSTPRRDTTPEVWTGVAMAQMRARYPKCI